MRRCGDGRGGDRGLSCQSEGVTAWIRVGGGADQRSTQHCAALLGHTQLATTAIDVEAVRKEERAIAARMWQ
jgi:hypothetical protein